MSLTRTELLYCAALVAGAALFCVLSVSNLTSWPAFWYDEAVAVEIAHNFADTGVLNVSVAPNEYSPYGMMIGANGYPLTAPLAGVFKLFGFSLWASRFVMLLWCIGFVAALFFFVKKYFGISVVALSGLLTLSFSSFFANGRTVTGEIPGFTLLILGFWLLLRERYLYSGILLGLAAAAKPSIYLFLCIPAALDVLLFAGATIRSRIKNLCLVAAGYVMPIVAWLVLTVPWPLPASFIEGLVQYYKNPFGSNSIVSNIFSNISQAPHNTTILYFVILAAAVSVAWYLIPKEQKLNRVYLFFTVVAALSLFYYLRSPGWLRYLIPLELSVFVLLPHALQNLVSKFRLPSWFVPLAVAGLVSLQVYILCCRSDIGRSVLPEQVSAYINAHLNGETVGVINTPTIAALVPASQTYQYISMAGIPDHGVNALALPKEKLPKFLVLKESYIDLIKGNQKILSENYTQLDIGAGGYLIYERQK